MFFCVSCATDLREKNVDLHKEMNHRVEEYDHDPRALKSLLYQKVIESLAESSQKAKERPRFGVRNVEMTEDMENRQIEIQATNK